MKPRGLLLIALLLISPFPALAADDRVQLGHDIVVRPDETLGDAVCIGCSIRVEGTLNGDAVAIGGHLDIDGPVRGDSVAVGGNLKLGSHAEVGGDAVSVGGHMERDAQATVAGETVSTLGLPIAGAGFAGMLFFAFLAFSVINLVLVLLCYALLGGQRVEIVAQAVRHHGWMAFLAGLAGSAGAVMLFFIAALTGPATPLLATAVSIALVAALVVGYAGIGTWIGRALASGAGPLGALLIGALVITVVQAIPVVNFFAIPIFLLLALGAAILSGFGIAPNWLGRQISAPPRMAPPHPPR